MRSFLIKFFLICLTILTIGCSSSHSAKPYRIAVDVSWYPLEMMGKENNVLGFSRELLEVIAKENNVSFDFITMNWDSLEIKLKEKKYDAILSSLQPLPFYEEVYQFSELYLQTGPVIVMRNGTRVKDLNVLKGKEIAVQRGSTSGVRILEKIPDVIIRVYDSIPRALNDTVNEVIDGAILDNLIATSYCYDIYQGQLEIVTPPLDQEGLRMVVLYDQNEYLMKIFDKTLSSLKKNGKYQKLLQKWQLAVP